MKHWWTLWETSTRWDAPPERRTTAPRESDKHAAHPAVRALARVHEVLQQQRVPAPPPPPDLQQRILQAVRREPCRPSEVRKPDLARFMRPAMCVPAALIAALAGVLWLQHRPQPLHTILPEPPHIWIGEAQLQAQNWARQIFEPDLARLQEEWERTHQEVRLMARHVWESVP